MLNVGTSKHLKYPVLFIFLSRVRKPRLYTIPTPYTVYLMANIVIK